MLIFDCGIITKLNEIAWKPLLLLYSVFACVHCMAFCLHKRHTANPVYMKILGTASLAVLVLAFQRSRAVCVHGCCRQPALRAAAQAPLPMQLKAGAGLTDYTMPTAPTSRGALQPHPSLWASLRKHLDFRELLHANPERSGTHLHLQTENCALGVVSRVRNQHAFQLLQRPLRKQKKK